MVSNIEGEMVTFKKDFEEIESEATNEGQNLKCFYQRFLIEVVPQTIPYQELTDEEILTLAEKTGTFDFLHSPEEDIYDPSDGTPSYEKR